MNEDNYPVCNTAAEIVTAGNCDTATETKWIGIQITTHIDCNRVAMLGNGIIYCIDFSLQ